MKKNVLTVVLMVAFVCAFAQQGVLDQSFGNNGKVKDTLLSGEDMIVQPDNKIIVLSSDAWPHWDSLMLIRYNQNGTRDSSFGINGFAYLKASANFELGYRVALQPDGKILVGGVGGYIFNTASGSALVARFNVNGTPDVTFGTNGYVLTDFSTGLERVYAMLVKPNGKILITASLSKNSGSATCIAQYDTSGNLDVGFGTGGKIMTRLMFAPRDIKVESGGKILIAGADSSVSTTRAVIIRLNVTGTLDTTFGVAGKVTAGITTGSSYGRDMAILANNKILLLTKTANQPGGFGVGHIGLYQFHSNGTTDYTFGTNGSTYNEFSPNPDEPRRIFVRPDGSIIVAAQINYSGADSTFAVGPGADFGIARFFSNGILDLSFGRNGLVRTDFGLTDYLHSGAGFDSNGRFILAGFVTVQVAGSGFFKIGISRYLPFNTSNQYNTIKGGIFKDRNFNGVKDTSEQWLSNASISVKKTNTGNTTLVSSANGQFSIAVDTGSYNIKPVSYGNYIYAPSSANTSHSTYLNTDSVVFAAQDTNYYSNIVLQSFSSGSAKPGGTLFHDHAYTVYALDSVFGATLEIIKDQRVSFQSSYPVAPTSINGDTLRWSFNIYPAWLKSINVLYTINTSVNVGDTLITTTRIYSNYPDANPADNVSVLKDDVKASWDPNDKTENHGGKITHTKAVNGEYLTYSVRFQNKGNDTAFNVYIRDTMDSKLDWNSLQIVASSHNYKMTMNDGKCLFTFPFIMLVDSLHNEPKSHGYIVYKIKAKPNVQIGDVIKNMAAIYFDYNLPIITNTETTTVVAEILPLKLLSFTARKQDKTNLLNWATAQEINVDHFEIERSTIGRDFNKIGVVISESAVGSSHNYSYTDNNPFASPLSNSVGEGPGVRYYRLKMIDKDGQFTYSPIRQININHSTLNIAIFPNPAKDKLQLQIDSDKRLALKMDIITQDGKVVLSSNVSTTEGIILRSINISALQSGMYFLRVTSGESEQTVIKFEKL